MGQWVVSVLEPTFLLHDAIAQCNILIVDYLSMITEVRKLSII